MRRLPVRTTAYTETAGWSPTWSRGLILQSVGSGTLEPALDLPVATHKGVANDLERREPASELTMGPLKGVRVLEAGLLVQGPQASLTMQEWGADVIKIKLPGFGDQSRWLPIGRGDRRSAFFTAYNRGKRSMTIDLRVPKGREVFLRLVKDADVVITNFKPGTMEGWDSGMPMPPPATTGSSTPWDPPSGLRVPMRLGRGGTRRPGRGRADQHDRRQRR